MALIILLIITTLCLGADFFTANVLHQGRDIADRETILSQPYSPPYLPGVAGHILGTDEFGRDAAARLLYGGQVTLTVGYLSAIITLLLGTGLGLLSGYFRGWVGGLINLLIQFIINLPVILVLIVLSFFVRYTPLTLALYIGLISWIGCTRIVRGQVIITRNREYIQATRAMGASWPHILLRHVLPNVAPVIFVIAAFDVVGAMLNETALSYLGFGLSIPIPSWGNLLSNRVSLGTLSFFDPRLEDASLFLVVPPALVLVITLVCVYLVANGLRDALDYRLNTKK